MCYICKCKLPQGPKNKENVFAQNKSTIDSVLRGVLSEEARAAVHQQTNLEQTNDFRNNSDLLN